MSTKEISRDFIRYAIFTILILWSFSFYSYTTLEFCIKYIGLAGALLILITCGKRAMRLEGLNWPETLLLSFFTWLIVSSFFHELFVANEYFTYLNRGGFRAFLYILNQWGLWGLLFFLIAMNSSQLRDQQLYDLLWIPLFILIAGIFGGLIPRVLSGDLFSNKPLTVFNNQHGLSSLFLNVNIPFVLAMFFHCSKKNKLRQSVYGLVLIGGILSVFLTTSRGGLSSLYVTLGLFCSIVTWIKGSSRSLYWGILVILLASLILVGFSFFQPNNTFKEFSDIKNVQSLSGRTDAIWPNTINFIKKRPIFGYSAGTYFSHSKLVKPDSPQPNAHNIWLQAWFDSGIIGFVLLGISMLLILWDTMKRIWRNDSYFYFHVALLCSLLSTFFVHGFIESTPIGLAGYLLGISYLLRSLSEGRLNTPT